MNATWNTERKVIDYRDETGEGSMPLQWYLAKLGCTPDDLVDAYTKWMAGEVPSGHADHQSKWRE